MTQNRNHLSEIFAEYPADIQALLADVLRLEQQYITESLHPNSLAFKELRDKIDDAIEKVLSKK